MTEASVAIKLKKYIILTIEGRWLGSTPDEFAQVSCHKHETPTPITVRIILRKRLERVGYLKIKWSKNHG